jgi:hypothetical protein
MGEDGIRKSRCDEYARILDSFPANSLALPISFGNRNCQAERHEYGLDGIRNSFVGNVTCRYIQVARTPRRAVKVFLLPRCRARLRAIFHRSHRDREIAFQIAVYVTVKGQWRIEGGQRRHGTKGALKNEEEETGQGGLALMWKLDDVLDIRGDVADRIVID